MSFLFRRTKLRRTAYSKDIKYSVKHEEVEHKEVRCIFRVASDINGETITFQYMSLNYKRSIFK